MSRAITVLRPWVFALSMALVKIFSTALDTASMVSEAVLQSPFALMNDLTLLATTKTSAASLKISFNHFVIECC